MTEDRRISLSPQEREGRFDRLATEAKEYALFLVDPGGKLICWNPGAERLFGYRVPYFVWVSIATVIQLSITAMNW